MTLPPKKIYRAWLRVGDRDVPTFAEEDGTRIAEKEVSLCFRATVRAGELDAIALGQAYAIEERKPQTVMTEIFPKSATAQIAPRQGKQWEIAQQTSQSAIAYYFEGEQGVEVRVCDRVSGNNQIAIAEGGAVAVSPNLIGKAVKVRLSVIVPRCIVILPHALKDPIQARFVIRTKDDSAHLLTVRCQENKSSRFLDGALRQLRFTFDDFTLDDLLAAAR